MYRKDSIVVVRPFSRQLNGEEVVIGILEKGVFLALPPEAVDLLDKFAAGKTVGEAADFYREATGETPDMDDFLTVLEINGLIEPASTDAGDKIQQPIREPKYHFRGFPQSLARRLFSYPVLACAGALIALAITLIVRGPSPIPGPTELVFEKHRALGLTLITVVGYGGVFLHEMAHLVAARSLGVNAHIGISLRLWYIVFETDMTGLWSLPKQQRYLPMLAGILFDAALGSLFVVLIFAGQHRLFMFTPWTETLLRAAAFITLTRILFEFFLFVRTDIYYVAATFLNCKNMLDDTRVFLRNKIARFRSHSAIVDQSGIPLAERRAIRFYSVFYLAGIVWAFGSLICVTIPFCASYGVSLMRAFRAGYSANPPDFIDAALACCYFLVPTVAGIVVWGWTLIHPKGTPSWQQ
jgi:putative peptide zinc metalloprotease protein